MQEGNQHSVKDYAGDEIYRLTDKGDRWLWCDKYGQAGGDNIDLVREIEGESVGFAEAVYRLRGAPLVAPQRPRTQAPPAKRREPPAMPRQTEADIRQGRAYLQSRCISPDTIRHAEKSGFLRYTGGGVLFMGRDQAGNPQNVTRRATAADPRPKRDFKGSDKSWPQILPGDPSNVWIVEGGVDALATQDLARLEGREPPTVIVSGGAGVRSFLDRAEVQDMLRQAEAVTVAMDNDPDPETQARTEAGHQAQGDKIEQITGRKPEFMQPETVKDIADVLEARIQLLEQVEEMQRMKEEQEKRRQARSKGFEMEM